MGVYSELYIDFIENYPQLIEGTEKFDFMFDMFIALKRQTVSSQIRS